MWERYAISCRRLDSCWDASSMICLNSPFNRTAPKHWWALLYTSENGWTTRFFIFYFNEVGKHHHIGKSPFCRTRTCRIMVVAIIFWQANASPKSIQTPKMIAFNVGLHTDSWGDIVIETGFRNWHHTNVKKKKKKSFEHLYCPSKAPLSWLTLFEHDKLNKSCSNSSIKSTEGGTCEKWGCYH